MSTQSITLPIDGMHCASCVAQVEKSLAAVAGVDGAAVNLATESAHVTYDPQVVGLDDLRTAVERVGYKLGPDAEPQATVLAIEGMHCASCVASVERALKAVPGVADASVNLATETAHVTLGAGGAGRGALVKAVEVNLDASVYVPDNAQVVIALGAAVGARRKYEGKQGKGGK